MSRIFLAAFLCAAGLALSAERADEVVFCHYNLENYGDGSAPGETSKYGSKPKSPEAIAAVVRIIAEIRPDVLGLCEMGSPEKFTDFLQRLRELGLDYPHTELVLAVDAERHLALASRFPIISRQSVTDARFVLNGTEERVRRGFLDVTIQLREDYALRCVGAHLKSRLSVAGGEALVRRLEAQQLRRHLDKIFAADPQVNLLCYGDFNDSKNEPAFQEIAGPKGGPGALTELICRDREGDRWTHYWRANDQYTRIDYLLVSAGLSWEIAKEKCGIFRSANGVDWSEASDHRPVFMSVRPLERRR